MLALTSNTWKRAQARPWLASPVQAELKINTHETSHITQKTCNYWQKTVGAIFTWALPLYPWERMRGQKRIFLYLPAHKCAGRETTIQLSLVNHSRRPVFSSFLPLNMSPSVSLVKVFTYSHVLLSFPCCLSTHRFPPVCVLSPSFSCCVFALSHAVCCSLSLSLCDWGDKPFTTLFHYCICSGLKATTSC